MELKICFTYKLRISFNCQGFLSYWDHFSNKQNSGISSVSWLSDLGDRYSLGNWRCFSNPVAGANSIGGPAEVFVTSSCVFTLVIPRHAEISVSCRPGCSFLFCCVIEELCEHINQHRVILNLKYFCGLSAFSETGVVLSPCLSLSLLPGLSCLIRVKNVWKPKLLPFFFPLGNLSAQSAPSVLPPQQSLHPPGSVPESGQNHLLQPLKPSPSSENLYSAFTSDGALSVPSLSAPGQGKTLNAISVISNANQSLTSWCLLCNTCWKVPLGSPACAWGW